VRTRVLLSTLFFSATVSCTTLPEPKFQKHEFPEDAYVENVKRPYTKVGTVRSKVNFPSLDFNRDENFLCRNYYNKAVRDLVKMAKKSGADAVINVKSVVFLGDGRQESYSTPECADDGEEGQILTQGTAVKWTGTEDSDLN